MLFSEVNQRKDLIFSIIITLICLILPFFSIPLGGERGESHSVRVRAKVLSVDNSEVDQYGIVKTGQQAVEVQILNGPYKGERIQTVNTLMGKMDLDKMFAPGDIALTVLNLSVDKKEIIHAAVIDHYRIRVELLLFLLFIGLIIAYAGWTGFRAMISFVFTGLMIWKVMIPGFLLGISPILLANAVVALFTAVIIFLIAGFNRTGLIAYISSMTGVTATTLFSLLFGKLFNVHGAVRPFTEMLLYSGYANLDITDIFIAGIFLASSGAVMDIAMDISASMNEVKQKKSDISRKELFFSGLKVGRAVVGTMTTTLLLAYSGGYTSLLMVFMAQGTPVVNILNLNYVSAEILHTLVGSFGLILVAPLTALIGSFLLTSCRPVPLLEDNKVYL
jgi:uncharacterized membrane protein